MYQLIGAALCISGVALAMTKDPIIGLLLVVCAIVWAATTPALTPLRRQPKPTLLIRVE